MRKIYSLFLLAFLEILSITQIFGQGSIPSSDITLSNASTTSMSVAWHPTYRRYYTSSGGYNGSPITTYEENGTIVGTSSHNFDNRGLWYNSLTNRIEGNDYYGKYGYYPNNGNLLSGNVVILATYSPSVQYSQRSHVFLASDNEFYRREGSTLYVYNSSGVRQRTVNLTLPSGQTFHDNGIACTDLSGKEIALYAYSSKRIYLFSKTGGSFVYYYQLPDTAPSNSSYGFSFANNRFFISNSGGSTWYGYPITSITTSGNTCLPTNSVTWAISHPDISNPIVSYSWSFPDGQTSTNSSVTKVYPTDGTFTATCNVTLQDGEQRNLSSSITIYELPTTSNSGPDQIICSGSSITLAANTPTIGLGVWSLVTGPNTPTITNTSSPTSTVTGLSAGTYNFKWTISNGTCPSSEDQVLVSVGVTNAGTLSGTQSICSSQTSQFTSTVSGGSWSTSNSNVATVDVNTGLVTGVAAGTATITYTVAGTGGCANGSATRTVTVTSAPNAGTITGVQSINLGSTSQLTTNGNSGGAWSSSDNNIATVNSNGLVTGVSGGSATITYTITGTGGCANATATIAMTIVPCNAGTISGTQNICVAGTSQFSSDGTTGGSWTTSASGVATVSSSGLVTGVAAGTATITYTVTGTGCSNSSTRTITVTAAPVSGVLSGIQAICVAGTSQLTTSGSTGGSWTSSASGIATVSSSGLVTGVTAGTATISYTVAGSGGCANAASTRQVTITAAPNAGTLSGNQAICVNGVTVLTSSGDAGGTWTSSNTNVVTLGNVANTTGGASEWCVIYDYETQNGRYRIGIDAREFTGTGVSPSNVNALKLFDLWDGPVTFGSYDPNGWAEYYAYTTTQFNFAGSAYSAYLRSGNGYYAAKAEFTFAPGAVTGVAAGTATISYTVAGTGGCANATATRTVTVSAPPTSGTLSGTQTVFVGATTTFASTVTGGSWTSSNTSVATVNASTGVVTGVATGTATITYTVAGTGGCSNATATRTVTVYACPTIAALSPSADRVCAATSITLTAAGLTGMSSLSSGITFKYSTTALSDPYVGGTVIATVANANLESSGSIARTTTSLTAGGTYYIYAVLSTTPDGTGCRPFATTTVVVNPNGQVTLPANSVVCSGTSIAAQTLTTTNSGGTTTYAWTNSATSIGLAASGSTATIPAFTATNTGAAGVTATISVTPTYTDGGLSCVGAASSYTITVNPIPALTAVSNQVICNGSTGAVSFNSSTNPAQNLSVSSGAISVAIPDGNAAGVTSALTATIPTGATLTGIAVNFNINHTWDSDLIINLVAPNGQVLNLVNGRGGSGDNFTNTVISSASTTSLATGTAPFTGTFAADAASGVGPTSFLSSAANFAALYSGTTSGSWRLAIRDRFSGDAGTLTSWSITFTYTPSPSVSWTNSNTAIGLAASGTGNISFTATNPGPDQISSTITATPSYENAGLTCTGTPITFTLAVNPNGQVNTVNNQVLCNGSATSAVTFTTTNNGLVSTGGTQTASSGTISVSVPDASAVGATSTIPVTLPTGAVISNVRVTMNMTHTFISDMVINLKAPNGQILNLFNQHGGAGDNLVNTVVSSTGTTAFASGTAPFTGTFAATAATGQGPTGNSSNAANFAALYSTPNGNWVLAMRDLFGGDLGILTSWSISFDYTVQGSFGTNMNWTNSLASIGLAATGTGNIPSFTAVNNGSAPVTSTVTVTPVYFNGGTSCAGTPTTFTYTVNPTATVNAVANQTFCAGTPSTVNFSGNATGTVYSWTNSNTAIGLAASGTGNLSFTPTNTGTTPIIATITVTPSFTNAGVTCTGTPRTFTIMVNPVGQVNAVNSQVLCNGSNTTAVNFATVNGGGTIVAGTPVTANSGTIAVTVPDANAAGISSVLPVTLPAGATITGVSVNFNMTHTWVSDMVLNLQAPNGQILNLVNRRGGAGVNFTNTTISSTGTAVLATAPFTGTFAADAAIGVGPTAAASAAANFAALYTSGTGNWTLWMRDYVGGDVGTLTNWSITINYTILQPAVTSYAWTNNTSSIGLAASGSGNIASFAAVNTTAAPVTATVTVTPTYTNNGAGCAGTPITYTYTVNPTPTVNAVSNQTVCRGSNTSAVTFTGATTGTVYNWTNSNTAIGLAASGTGNIPSFAGTNTTAAPITGTITVTPVYTNAGVTCTGTPRTFTITVNPIPTVNPVASFPVCHNSVASATFSGATTGTVFSWTNSNPAIGLAASGTGNISFTAVNTTSAPVTATITVTPSFTNGGTTCVGTPTSFVITVNPLPVVTTGTIPARVCISDTLVRLSGTPVGGSWSGFGISGYNFVPPATAVGAWPITYTYADANGCVNRATTTVTVQACEERNRDLDNGAVILYPNPNSGQFNIRINSALFNVLGAKIYNSAGQVVYTNQWRSLVFGRVIPVNLNNLAAGVYMVRLYYGDGMDRGADKTYQIIIAR